MNLRHLYFDIVSDFDIRISCLWRTFSTAVEKVRQLHPKKCKTNPILPHFSHENDDFTKKQSQFKPNTNPIQTQYKANYLKGKKMMHTQYLQRFIENIPPLAGVRANPNKPNTKLVLDWCLLAFLSGSQKSFALSLVERAKLDGKSLNLA